MNLKIVVLVLFAIMGNASAQNFPASFSATKIPVPAWHYQDEYNFDVSSNPSAWNSAPRGLQVSFASTDALYMRADVPQLVNKNLTWDETGWAGERLNAQLLIWSPDTVKQIRLKISDLKSIDRKIIKAENIQSNLVRYVVSNYPYGSRTAQCDVKADSNVYLMPDRFENFERFDLPGQTVRPIWISVNIPQKSSPGNYRGELLVQSQSGTVSLKINMKVQNQQLPPPSKWHHRLDIWQNPWVVAWMNHVKPWSAEHMILLRKHMELYADAGGTYITTYAVHSPWSDNSYMIEGGMIEWTKLQNGQWKFDYSIFDKYVQLCMNLGINRAITIYTPVPWGFRFRYLDAATGNYKYESWAPTSPEFVRHWNVFLTDLKRHLEQKGWFDITYLGINENPMPEVLAAINMIRKHSPKWKITYAGDYHKELEFLLDDYCYLYGKESDVSTVEKRSGRKLTTTWYVCCNPPYPNNFLFSPPVEGRWMGWYSTAHKYDGFLRWAYDAWPADPARDARHVLWPAGDCFLVYPGGNSCIRFEKLREGIVDYEKIRILRDKYAKTNNPKAKLLLGELDALLKVFLAEKDFNTAKITSDVSRGRKILEQLSDIL